MSEASATKRRSGVILCLAILLGLPLTVATTLAQGSPSAVHLFWSANNSNYFYTISAAEKDRIIANFPTNIWEYLGVSYYAYAPGDQPAGTKAIHRFYSPSNRTHFFTRSEAEKNRIIASYPETVWRYEGVAWYAYDSPAQAEGAKAVHRFWSPTNKGHFFTASEAEKNTIIAVFPDDVWRYEGVAWYACGVLE
jgi:hypothetical protein